MSPLDGVLLRAATKRSVGDVKIEFPWQTDHRNEPSGCPTPDSSKRGRQSIQKRKGHSRPDPDPTFSSWKRSRSKAQVILTCTTVRCQGSWAILTLSRATTASPRWQSGRMVGNDQRVRRPLGVITVTMPESGNRHIDYTVPDDSGRELLFADITCSGFSNDDSN